MTRARGLLLLVAVTVVWGATFAVVKGALADSGPLTFLALRFGLAAVAVLPALRRAGGTFAASPWVTACGVALFAGYAFQTAGLATTTPARAAFITALSVVLVPLAEPLLGISAFSARAWAGAGLALAGLAVLLRPESQPLSVGDLLTFGCAVAFAAHILVLQLAVRKVAPGKVNAAQVVVMAALALPAGAIEGFDARPTGRLALALVVTALLATVAAFYAMAAVQRVLSAGETAVVLAFEPVAAGVISVLAGEDPLSLGLVAGGVLVVAGVLIATAGSRAPVALPPQAS